MPFQHEEATLAALLGVWKDSGYASTFATYNARHVVSALMSYVQSPLMRDTARRERMMWLGVSDTSYCWTQERIDMYAAHSVDPVTGIAFPAAIGIFLAGASAADPGRRTADYVQFWTEHARRVGVYPVEVVDKEGARFAACVTLAAGDLGRADVQREAASIAAELRCAVPVPTPQSKADYADVASAPLASLPAAHDVTVQSEAASAAAGGSEAAPHARKADSRGGGGAGQSAASQREPRVTNESVFRAEFLGTWPDLADAARHSVARDLEECVAAGRAVTTWAAFERACAPAVRHLPFLLPGSRAYVFMRRYLYRFVRLCWFHAKKAMLDKLGNLMGKANDVFTGRVTPAVDELFKARTDVELDAAFAAFKVRCAALGLP